MFKLAIREDGKVPCQMRIHIVLRLNVHRQRTKCLLNLCRIVTGVPSALRPCGPRPIRKRNGAIATVYAPIHELCAGLPVENTVSMQSPASYRNSCVLTATGAVPGTPRVSQRKRELEGVASPAETTQYDSARTLGTMFILLNNIYSVIVEL